MPRTKPTEDSAEKIKRCLCCELEECNNCWARKGKKEKQRKDHVLNFFGEILTIREIANKTGITYRRIYSWNRYGGESWVEQRAKKHGYKP